MKTEFPWSPQTASERTVAAFKRIESDTEAFRSVFVRLFKEEALQTAASLPSATTSPLAGALVTIKDLYDVKGYVTTAGTKVRATQPVAQADSDAVAAVRAAGAVMLGHSNMTEFAYSGLGLNPHYGTPENPVCPGHVPGGSTSGGAVSVALGLADIAFGSDTGGSLRIPAAFTGIVGFKPSQESTSRRGVVPLSGSLDSVGPMARTVAACHAAWSVLAGCPYAALQSEQDRKRRYLIPSNFGLDALDPAVERKFRATVAAMIVAGMTVEERPLPVLDSYKTLPLWQFAAVESRATFATLVEEKPELFDPRVLIRMQRAEGLSAIEYRQTLDRRESLIAAFNAAIGEDTLLLPTVAIGPPRRSELESQEAYDRVNLMTLRNTTLANVIDGCSVSLPTREGGVPLGIMLTKRGGQDLALLAEAQHLEEIMAAC
ncbi:amidase family protein [Limibacillus halophilus]|uniref:Aspartyl-tRNA(Asn)/glutamyl-tRNA(Gln) amidotransferase subunit A n=1 Tax=Limibacillus halophilus TaxID=1579333 RepID=A0A839STV0_9PROT|nr:amidase family protein [Limibacillus halophilus]MBB3066221.1 aspartyl-tRNA(Asn)/glutamyl-tRNA(Gln) amidotransferase subunit A [Limibacillus halophilus]